MPIRIFGVVIAVLAQIATMSSAQAQFIRICPISPVLTGETARTFEARRTNLLSEQIALVARGERFNTRCESVGQGTAAFENCAVEQGQLLDRRARLNDAVGAFCNELESARLRGEFERIMAGFEVHAGRRTDDKLDALFDEALWADWSATSRTGFLLSLLKVGRGAYARAREFIGLQSNGTDHDAFVARLDELVNQRMLSGAIPSGGPLVDPYEAERQVERTDIAIHGMILRGAYRLGQGNYEDAVRIFTEARGQAATSPSTRSALNDAIIWARQLRAAADERLQPGERDAIYVSLRDQAEAEQTWRLGWALAVSGAQPERALRLMEQAAEFFYEDDPDGVGAVVTSQLEQITRGEVMRNPSAARLLAQAPSRTHAVLDALEFGKGDWDRSLEYIRERRRILPDNEHLRDAEIYLEGLSAGRR